ncbi:9767_t:CDS:2 [Gigaspora margarita]|uniref:9767_t:CDS:1 n=1 Tax=Gigaspora margarita TaxID=4874 RepID=A0ABN7UL44_GIGMA|nr:9767_t:CDS:2 [Gigaspora margarita]
MRMAGTYESDYTDSNSIEFDKFTGLNEDVHDNVSDNLLKKENSQKNKKGKESVGGSLHSALRSYKSSVSSIDNK